MALHVDVFWSFRSPYSYLVTPRLRRLTTDYDVEVAVRPVLPLAVRNRRFFKEVNPLWPPYLMRDVVRLAEFHDMTIGWPRPDPIVQNLVTMEVSEEQPYIYELTRLGISAAEQGRGLDFIYEVSQIIWSGEVDGWDKGDHLERAVERAGLDLAGMRATVESNPGRFDERIERNQQDLQIAGHWGVPTMVFEREPFFGQDRFDVLKWRLEQNGLKPRQESR